MVNDNKTVSITERREKSSNGLVIFPYVQATTEQLKHVVEKCKLDASMKPIFTLR